MPRGAGVPLSSKIEFCEPRDVKNRIQRSTLGATKVLSRKRNIHKRLASTVDKDDFLLVMKAKFNIDDFDKAFIFLTNLHPFRGPRFSWTLFQCFGNN